MAINLCTYNLTNLRCMKDCFLLFDIVQQQGGSSKIAVQNHCKHQTNNTE